ncbi:MAG: tripartite tricarboxylate transporter substrate binding protein [Betaproteobacteria bacterium]|nr:tripartite tricarboxylate transporter substrate binding protein [Betaproteobacteria bacterium]
MGFTAGGGGDTTARMVARKLSEHLGQPVVVENRAGASGAIANELVATSPADGYTLLMVTATATIVSALRARLPYDLERDFAPVSLVVSGPFVLVVHPSVPVRSAKELIALARSQPGKLNYGSTGVGTSTHLAGELLNLMARVNIIHVPYKGSADAAVATAAGEIDMSFPSITAALPLLQAGKFRAIAVTGTKRASLLPLIPALNESGLPGYDRVTWRGVLAPAGVPKNIIARLNEMIRKVINTAEMRASFGREGMEPHTSTPEEFAAYIHREIAQNAKLIKFAGMKAL